LRGESNPALFSLLTSLAPLEGFLDGAASLFRPRLGLAAGAIDAAGSLVRRLQVLFRNLGGSFAAGFSGGNLGGPLLLGLFSFLGSSLRPSHTLVYDTAG